MNLPMPVAVGLWIVLGLLLLLVMWLGWRAQQRRGASRVQVLAAVPPVSSLGAERTGPIEGTYVSSTAAGDWLDRVTARELGARAKAVVQVFDGGVLVARAGADDVFVPAGDLRGASRSAGIAGKYVGGEGMVLLHWSTPSAGGQATALDTGVRTLRKADREVLVDAVTALVAERSDSSSSSSSLSTDSRNDPKESE